MIKVPLMGVLAGCSARRFERCVASHGKAQHLPLSTALAGSKDDKSRQQLHSLLPPGWTSPWRSRWTAKS